MDCKVLENVTHKLCGICVFAIVLGLLLEFFIYNILHFYGHNLRP